MELWNKCIRCTGGRGIELFEGFMTGVDGMNGVDGVKGMEVE
jgi:hypothetical protein